jgi:CRP-like cAMP-binding protein
MTGASVWPRNRLLLALPSRNLTRLTPELEQIPCQHGQILLDADSSLEDVFFPDSGVISVVAVYEDGNIIEMATIGREGCTGFKPSAPGSLCLFVQIPERSKMCAPHSTERGLDASSNLMYAYVHAFLKQVLVSAACNGAHNLKERLARWLLMMRDRSDGETLQITQNLLAHMLGVQRPTVTNAVRELERAHLIAPGRRQVTIHDRQGLIKESCECYQLVRTRIAFHLPKTYP